MNQKFLLFGIIVLILVGVGSYVLGTKNSQPAKINSLSISPTAVQSNEISDETSNWKIYVNTVFNFSVKYPQGWIIDEGSVNYLSNEKGEKIPSQTIVLKDANSSTNIFMIGNFQGGWGYGVTWTETFIVSNSNVKITKYTNSSSETVYYIIVLPVGFLFTTATPAKQENLFDQILSTLRFSN